MTIRRHQVVLTRGPGTTDGFVEFDPPNGEQAEVFLTIEESLWSSMGEPDEITVLVVPGARRRPL